MLRLTSQAERAQRNPRRAFARLRDQVRLRISLKYDMADVSAIAPSGCNIVNRPLGDLRMLQKASLPNRTISNELAISFAAGVVEGRKRMREGHHPGDGVAPRRPPALGVRHPPAARPESGGRTRQRAGGRGPRP